MVNETVSQPLAPIKPAHTTLTSATVDAIGKAIQSGVFKHGTQLPPEKDLMTMLGVSRTTLREALSSLEELGLIVRRRGLGTFVAEQSIVKDLSSNFGITDMIRQAGMTPGSLESEVRSETAPAVIAAGLQLADGCQVMVVDRVRTADGKPAVWSLDYFSPSLISPQMLSDYTLQESSLYQFLSDRLQIGITHGIAKLLPISANAQIAAKLQIRKGTALMCITQTDYTAANQPVLCSIEYHLADLFVFMIHRKGPQW
jgi:GntR family transcriptional regulator